MTINGIVTETTTTALTIETKRNLTLKPKNK